MSTGTLTYRNVSRLYCRPLRAALARWKFQGHAIEWLESEGTFFRTFTIKGPMDTLKHIDNVVQKWSADDYETTSR